jgi:hypothetical protein
MVIGDILIDSDESAMNPWLTSENTPAWCKNSHGGSSFSWLRGGPARAMEHLGEYAGDVPSVGEQGQGNFHFH